MGKIFCLMGKSACGKDTIYKRVLSEKSLSLNTLVPYTTRPARNGEQDGVEYYFLTDRQQQELERQGKTLLTVDRCIPTTRTCSACGAVRDAVHYKENTWRCPKCGAVHRREANAAKNIKAQGLARHFSLHEQCESS